MGYTRLGWWGPGRSLMTKEKEEGVKKRGDWKKE